MKSTPWSTSGTLHCVPCVHPHPNCVATLFILQHLYQSILNKLFARSSGPQLGSQHHEDRMIAIESWIYEEEN
jgi:hypothetical protein